MWTLADSSVYTADVIPGGAPVALGTAGVTVEIRPTNVNGGMTYDIRLRNRTATRFMHKKLEVRFPRMGTGQVTIGGITQAAPLKVRQSWRPPNAGLTGVKFGFFYDIASGTNVLRTEGPATSMSPAWIGTTDGIVRADGSAYGILEFWQRQPRSIEVTPSEVVLTLYSAADSYAPTFGDGEPLRNGEDAWDRFGVFPANLTDAQIVSGLENLPALSQAEKDALVARFEIAPFNLTNTDPVLAPSVNPLLRKYDKWQGTSWDKSYADNMPSRQWAGEVDSQKTTLWSDFAKGGPFGSDKPDYSWRDWGDIVWADGESGGHYDWLRSAFKEYLKGGPGADAALRWAMSALRHRIAVDQIWANAGNGFTPWLERYEKNDHGEGAASDPNGKSTHTWIWGLLLSVEITQDPWVREAALHAAEGEWYANGGTNVFRNDLGNGETRALGWPLLALTEAAKVTGDPKYWTKAKEIAANWVRLEARDGSLGWIKAWDRAYRQVGATSPFQYGYSSLGLIEFAEEALRRNDMPAGYMEMLGRTARWLSTPMPDGPYFPPVSGSPYQPGGWGGEGDWCPEPRSVNCPTANAYLYAAWSNQVFTDFFAWFAARIDPAYRDFARQVFYDTQNFTIHNQGIVGYLTTNFPNSETKLLGRAQLIGDYAAKWMAGLTTGSAPAPPNAPANLRATVFSAMQVELRWDDNSGDEDGFKIERRGPADPDFRETVRVGPNITVVTDGTVQPSSAYSYRVRAFNRGGDSDYSNTATATTPAQLPLAPLRLWARDENSTIIVLRWEDAANNETGFVAERSDRPDGGFVPVGGTLPPDTTEYWDSNRTPNTTYWYRVKAMNAAGESPPSNLVQGKTPGMSPPSFRYTFSPPRLIRDGGAPGVPSYESGYPDAAMAMLPGDNPANPHYLYADHHRMVNPLSTTPVYDLRPLLPGNWPWDPAHGPQPSAGSPDHCGDWFQPAFFQDPVNPQRIHAYLHREGDIDATPQGLCTYSGGRDGAGQGVQSIAYYYSDDNGENWIQADEALIESPFTSGRGFWSGVAQPILFTEGNYLYLFYRENGNTAVRADARDTGLTVARASIASRGRQGNWFKYYEGAFTEPGLGGRFTALFPGFQAPMGVGTNSLFAAKGIPYWLLGEGEGYDALLRFSNTLTSWSSTGGVPLFPRGVSSPSYGSPATALVHFPSLSFYETGSTQTRARFYYMYKPYGRDMGARLLVERDLLIEEASQYVPPAAPLIRYIRTDPRVETQATTELAYGRSGGAYQEEKQLGFTFTEAPLGGAASRELVNCYDPAEQDYYAVSGRSCDTPAHEAVESLGFVYQNQQPNTVGLYQCRDNTRNERFVSNSTSCEGQGAGTLLGYVEPPPPRNPGIMSIVPSSIVNDVTRTVRINGARFEPDAAVVVSIVGSPVPYPTTLTRFIDSSTIEITVPAGVTPLHYELAVFNPATQLSSNFMPFEVRAFQPDTESPIVRITTPTAGGTLAGNVTVIADATDNVGVAGVQFIVDGGNLGQEDTMAPYSVTWDTLAGSGELRVLSARARDAAGNTGIAPDVPVTVRNIPSPPSNLTATVRSATEIDLVWTNTATNATGVRIERSTTETVPFVTVPGASNLPPTTTAFRDAGLQPNTTYWYRVIAINAAGASNPSTPASATTLSAPDTQPPSVSIASPVPQSVLSGTITVRATATDNVGVIGVQFFLSGQNLGQEDTTPPYEIVWNTTTRPDGAYTFSARARDAAGNIGNAPNVPVTVNNQNPIASNPPSGLTATALTPTEIRLRWIDNATNESGFKIERKGPSDPDFREVFQVGANIVEITDGTLSPDTNYSYRMRAWNVVGNSAYSNTATARTSSFPPPPPPEPTPPPQPGGGGGGGGGGGSPVPTSISTPTPSSSPRTTLTAPSGLRALLRTPTHIELLWIDTTSDEDGFEVERSVRGAAFGAVRTVARNTTSLILQETATGTIRFRIRSYRGIGNLISYSGYSNVAVATASLVPATPFTVTLRFGMRHEEVRRLQAFLNRDSGTRVALTGVGSAGSETDFFGPGTRAAVTKFQEKYAQEILAPLGLARGTGVWGPATIRKANALFGSSVPTPPVLPANASLTRNLFPGLRDPEVMTLQQILNRDPDTRVATTGPGSSGQESDFYGSLTTDAVQRYQRKYTIVISGTPETTGYGVVGPRTRAALTR